MFIHNFKYSFRTLFKDKALIFWTFAFPIILGTLFSLAFSDIENSEKLKIIDIAIVDMGGESIYTRAFEELSNEENEDRLFNLKYASLDEAKKLLEDEEISGYLLIGTNPKIVVRGSGVNETVLKYTFEQILQYSDITNNLIAINMSNQNAMPENFKEYVSNIQMEVISKINRENNIKDISSKNLSYTMIEFYTLIAMAALYGGILGMVSILKCLPNMGSKGTRVHISPCKKETLVSSSLLASYTVQLIGLFLLFIYTIFVLDVDYGSDLSFVILTALVGSFTGLSLGVFVGSVFKVNENMKIGILLAITMFGSFLSGMMGITMKYIVDSNMPFINKINPAALITDALYSLYYYEGYTRFCTNIGILLGISIVLMVVSALCLRRQKYDSI